MQMTVVPETEHAVTRIVLQGRLDVAGVQAVEKEFQQSQEQAGQPLIIDMAAVDFLGSLGMRMLLAGAKSLGKRGWRMILLNPQPMVEETWYSAGLAALIPVEHDFARALTSCRETAG